MKDLGLLEKDLPRAGQDLDPGDDYFSSLARSFGAAKRTLAVGPLRVRLAGLSAGQASSLERRYRPFLVGDGAAADAEIELSPAGVPSFLSPPVPGAAEVYRMASRRTAGRLALWSYEFAGWLEMGRRVSRLALVEEEGELFFRGLENFLRVMTAARVLEEGGLLLHGAGVVRRGRAYVFFGPSGSGKTTVTHLSPEDTVLSDDLTLVVHRGGGYEAAGIPFGLAHHRVPATRDSFPIVSLNRLVQSTEVRRHRVAGVGAVAEILTSLPFVLQETGGAGRAMDVAAEVAATLPIWRLEFRKDPSFWGVVEEAD